MIKTQELTIEETRAMAQLLMSKHWLIQRGWVFEFDNAKRRLGNCSHARRRISLSRHYIPLLTKEEIKDTILHEIAHALVKSKHGHDAVWRQKAIEIGCNGQRLYIGAAKVKRKFKGTCPKCGKVILRHRRTQIACGRCCNGNFNPAYMFMWEINNDYEF